LYRWMTALRLASWNASYGAKKQHKNQEQEANQSFIPTSYVLCCPPSGAFRLVR
jgi:hypothetical protein